GRQMERIGAENPVRSEWRGPGALPRPLRTEPIARGRLRPDPRLLRGDRLLGGYPASPESRPAIPGGDPRAGGRTLRRRCFAPRVAAQREAPGRPALRG